MCAFYLSDVSRGREPNRRLAFGKRLRFLALCSVSILAVTLCRFAIYLKTALCRAAPLTSRPLTSILYRERVRSMGQEPNHKVGVRRLLANACVMQRVYLSRHFVSFRNISQNCPMPSSPVNVMSVNVHSILRTSPFQGAENPTAGLRSENACVFLRYAA